MSGSGWFFTLGIIYLVLLFTLAILSFRNGHRVLGLLGILLVISGILHLIRLFERAEPHRVWPGISGIAFIGLIIGISWMVQGLSVLVAGLSGNPREGRGWWIFFGVVSLIGGVIITAAPVTSVTVLAVLAVLIGTWFVIEGLFEITNGFMMRHAISKPRATTLVPSATSQDA